MSRSIHALNTPIHRMAGPLVGVAILACCFGQTCNLNPPANTNVLASTPDNPDEDGSADSVDTSTDPTVTLTNNSSGDQTFERIVNADERDVITLDFSDKRGPGRTFTWKQVSGPKVTIRATATAIASVSLPSVDSDAQVVLSLTQNTTDGPTVYLIQLNVRDLDGLVNDVSLQLSATSGIEPLSINATVVTKSGAPVTDGVYSWQFGDGSLADGTQVNHSFDAGTWTITLCATFGNGLASTSGCKDTTINVIARPTDGSAYVISGTVTANGNGLAGVQIAADGGVAGATTGSNGTYAIVVPAGWTGTLTPTLDGYALLPGNRPLTNVQSELSGQDFQAITLSQNNSVTIAGTVRLNSSALSGVTINATNGVPSVTTGSDGSYTLTVPFDWTGIVTPQKAGFAFTPGSRNYPAPTNSITGQDFSATPVNQAPIARAGDDRTIMIQSGNSVSVHLDGSASSDPDGSVVSYVWSENGNTVATTPQTDVNLALGAHTFKLRVTDNEGAIGEDTIVLSIGIPNSYYVALNGNDNWSGGLPSPNNAGTDGPFRTPNKAASITLPGDTVYIRGGTYSRTVDQNYAAGLEINNSGTIDAPITIRNFPGEKPIIQGSGGCAWAIRIGFVKYDGTGTSVHDVIVDGLSATLAPWDGIEVWYSYNITIRNCEAYTNNYNSPNGYKAGINIDVGHDITIDHCRIYDNGFGIAAYEDNIVSENPVGASNVTISNNFIFGNCRTGNAGNSSGIGLRFPNHANIVGNVIYDNPDAGINGEGHNFCRVLRNICINNWQPLPGANNEGIKICVRGGGCNTIAFNLSVNNGNTGYDAANGVGDVFVNNTVYHNHSWGVLAEGQQTMLWNNILAGNSLDDGNTYPDMDASGFSLISDWNQFGSGPLVYHANSWPIPSNTIIQSVGFTGMSLPRVDVHEVNPPEELWGVSTIEEARALIIAAYTPSAPVSGASLNSIQAACNANIPTVKTALDAAIARVASSPDFQMRQATSRWQALKAELSAYDLSNMNDLSGNSVNVNAAARRGAVQ